VRGEGVLCGIGEKGGIEIASGGVVGGGWWEFGAVVEAGVWGIMSGPSRVQGQGFGESGVGRVGGVGGGKVVLLLSRDLVLVGLL